MRYACEQVSLPVCSVLFGNRVYAKYPARAVELGPFLHVFSPYTIALLFCTLWISLVLTGRTRRMYSYPARKEMLMFLRFYAATCALDMVLALGLVRRSWETVYTLFVALQVSCMATCFVAAAGTGLIWIFPSKASGFCASTARTASVLSLGMLFAGAFFSTLVSFGFGVFLVGFAVPLVFGLAAAVLYTAKLARLNAEIWSYGSIFITACLVGLLAATPYALGMLVALLSNRYLDGIFLLHAFGFFAMLKLYNLWAMDREQEIECVNTLQEKERDK